MPSVLGALTLALEIAERDTRRSRMGGELFDAIEGASGGG